MEEQPVQPVVAVRHKGCFLRGMADGGRDTFGVRYAAMAGISVARAGRAPSMPRRAEIETMLAGR